MAEAPYDVLVVGAGLAGLVAGLAAARRGARTLVLAQGFGTIPFRSGTVDVLGYLDGAPVESPAADVAALSKAHPGHPYGVCGEGLEPALDLVLEAAMALGLGLEGSLRENRLVATAAGTLRPSCLVPGTMARRWPGARVLAVGFDFLRDFHPDLFAAVLPAAAAARGAAASVRVARVAVPGFPRHLDGLALARRFEDAALRRDVVRALKPDLEGMDVVAFPAVLGLDGHAEVVRELSSALGAAVAELPTLPPSVPGLRLQRALQGALERAGGRLQVGARARLVTKGEEVLWLEVESAARPLRLPVTRLVLATGGLVSGGLRLKSSGEVVEEVAGLPVEVPAGPSESWFERGFLDREGQAAARMGLRVDRALHPLEGGRPALQGVFAAGGLLAGADRAAEKSADGIACASGYLAGVGAAA
ncbi:MAG: anaerobic glycerol-3-phosphate dehydrogenase subunit GlpB [Candidatus Dormibacterales bacterium]